MTKKIGRRSIRLPKYDYHQPGMYFVTICVRNKACLLGEIIEGEMSLSDYGQIAALGWKWLDEHFSYVNIDISCIMPNHVHAIIQIYETGEEKTQPLGQLVRAYKHFTTKNMNQQPDAKVTSFWQRNYYEHIVRNQAELERIREYVVTNALKWALDHENPNNN